MPVPDEGRAKAWHELFKNYYAEFGIDLASAPSGPVCMPFDHAMADVV